MYASNSTINDIPRPAVAEAALRGGDGEVPRHSLSFLCSSTSHAADVLDDREAQLKLTRVINNKLEEGIREGDDETIRIVHTLGEMLVARGKRHAKAFEQPASIPVKVSPVHSNMPFYPAESSLGATVFQVADRGHCPTLREQEHAEETPVLNQRFVLVKLACLVVLGACTVPSFAFGPLVRDKIMTRNLYPSMCHHSSPYPPPPSFFLGSPVPQPYCATRKHYTYMLIVLSTAFELLMSGLVLIFHHKVPTKLSVMVAFWVRAAALVWCATLRSILNTNAPRELTLLFLGIGGEPAFVQLLLLGSQLSTNRSTKTLIVCVQSFCRLVATLFVIDYFAGTPFQISFQNAAIVLCMASMLVLALVKRRYPVRDLLGSTGIHHPWQETLASGSECRQTEPEFTVQESLRQLNSHRGVVILPSACLTAIALATYLGTIPFEFQLVSLLVVLLLGIPLGAFALGKHFISPWMFMATLLAVPFTYNGSPVLQVFVLAISLTTVVAQHTHCIIRMIHGLYGIILTISGIAALSAYYIIVFRAELYLLALASLVCALSVLAARQLFP